MLRLAQRTQSRNPVYQRLRKDRSTQLRLKYAPYYRSFDKQDGMYVWLEGQRLLMLSSNEYLGLSNHPRVVEASQRALATWGTGFTGSRMANGSRACHEELEAKLAAFVGKEAAHVSAAGYLSCVSAIGAFAERGDYVAIDRNVHSSLWTGVQLSGAKAERFSHNSAASLAEVLEDAPAGAGRFALLEGVYSMEGHLSPLDELIPAAQEADAFVVLDDAHGVGAFGPQGQGTAAHFGVVDAVDLICGSFSKALSSTGGFVCGSREAIDYLRTHAKPLIFSAAIAPAQAAAASTCLDLLRDEPEHRERLWENTEFFRGILESLGVDTWGSASPAIPIVIGSKERAWKVWRALLERGLFTVMATAPAVPPGKDLIRTAVSARHTKDQLSFAGDVIRTVLRKN
jgi:8-amino-7-oxononanoate synthase